MRIHRTLTVVFLLLASSASSAEVAPLAIKCRVLAAEGLSIALELENPSRAVVRAAGLQPYVELTNNERSFWAPFTLSSPPKPLAENGRQLLTLRGNQRRTFVLRLASLKWERTISSVWPARRFAATVPAGEYRVGIQDPGLGSAQCGSLTVK